MRNYRQKQILQVLCNNLLLPKSLLYLLEIYFHIFFRKRKNRKEKNCYKESLLQMLVITNSNICHILNQIHVSQKMNNAKTVILMKTELKMFYCPHCSMFSTILFSIVAPTSASIVAPTSASIVAPSSASIVPYWVAPGHSPCTEQISNTLPPIQTSYTIKT